MIGQVMHVSRDLGLHKLIIMPPSRPNDSNSMVAKIAGLTPLHQTTLLKSEQHKESSILMGLGRGATPWVLLGPEWTWVMGFLSYFPISHTSWLFPMVFELLFRSLLREQHQNSWFPVGWRAKMSWRCWSNLKMVDQLLLSRLRGWKLLFLSLLVKIRHDVGSTSNRYTAHPLTASISDFVGPTDRLSMAVWVLGRSPLGLQLSFSINPIAFRPK